MGGTATKARKANALIVTLAKLHRNEVLDDLALARLAREAQGLMKSDPAGAHMVLGGIAGIEGDVTRVCKHHEIALKLSGRSSQTLTNYAAALINVGEMNEAFTTIMEAHDRARGDLRVLTSAIGIAVQSAEFRRSHVLYHRWNLLRPQEPREDEELMKAAGEAIDRGAFNEEAARKVVRLAHQVRVKVGARYAESALVSVYGEPDRFGLDMHVHTSPGEAADLNEAFADQVVADDELLTELRLNFVPMFMGTRIDGSDSRSTA